MIRLNQEPFIEADALSLLSSHIPACVWSDHLVQELKNGLQTLPSVLCPYVDSSSRDLGRVLFHLGDIQADVCHLQWSFFPSLEIWLPTQLRYAGPAGSERLVPLRIITNRQFDHVLIVDRLRANEISGFSELNGECYVLGRVPSNLLTFGQAKRRPIRFNFPGHAGELYRCEIGRFGIPRTFYFEHSGITVAISSAVSLDSAGKPSSVLLAAKRFSTSEMVKLCAERVPFMLSPFHIASVARSVQPYHRAYGERGSVVSSFGSELTKGGPVEIDLIMDHYGAPFAHRRDGDKWRYCVQCQIRLSNNRVRRVLHSAVSSITRTTLDAFACELSGEERLVLTHLIPRRHGGKLRLGVGGFRVSVPQSLLAANLSLVNAAQLAFRRDEVQGQVEPEFLQLGYYRNLSHPHNPRGVRFNTLATFALERVNDIVFVAARPWQSGRVDAGGQMRLGTSRVAKFQYGLESIIFPEQMCEELNLRSRSLVARLHVRKDNTTFLSSFFVEAHENSPAFELHLLWRDDKHVGFEYEAQDGRMRRWEKALLCRDDQVLHGFWRCLSRDRIRAAMEEGQVYVEVTLPPVTAQLRIGSSCYSLPGVFAGRRVRGYFMKAEKGVALLKVDILPTTFEQDGVHISLPGVALIPSLESDVLTGWSNTEGRTEALCVLRGEDGLPVESFWNYGRALWHALEHKWSGSLEIPRNGRTSLRIHGLRYRIPSEDGDVVHVKLWEGMVEELSLQKKIGADQVVVWRDSLSSLPGRHINQIRTEKAKVSYAARAFLAQRSQLKKNGFNEDDVSLALASMYSLEQLSAIREELASVHPISLHEQYHPGWAGMREEYTPGGLLPADELLNTFVDELEDEGGSAKSVQELLAFIERFTRKYQINEQLMRDKIFEILDSEDGLPVNRTP